MAETEDIKATTLADTNIPDLDTLTPEETELIKSMMDIGVFYGRSKARTNPKMRKFILTNRSGFSVIDLQKTIEALVRATKMVEDAVAQKETVLLVGVSPSVKGAIKEVAEETNMPYVTERWLGGTLTNFETISKRINHLKKLKEEKAEGGWDKYTKKEQLDLEKELNKLQRLFGGIETLTSLPKLVFVADVASNQIPAKEARALGIPVLGIINTDADPSLVDQGIPANERSVKSVEFIMDRTKEAILAGKVRQVSLDESKGEDKEKEEIKKTS
ncbi:MAG: 30S ribosomal protein S2 [Candidatus Colwellbacteria bacterium]